MCGNGAVIGMAVIHRQHKPILPGLQAALTVVSVAVAGTTALATVVLRIAASTTLATATATLVSV